jgi:hypothetical protein
VAARKSGTELTLMLWPQHQAGICLRVLPPAEMAKMMADIDAMPNGNPNKVSEKIYWQRIRPGDFGQGGPDLSAGRNGARGGHQG